MALHMGTVVTLCPSLRKPRDGADLPSPACHFSCSNDPPALPSFALLCPPLESLALVRLLDSLRGGRCNCPVALTGHVSVGYVSVEIPRHRPCPLTDLSVNRPEPLTRCPTQPVAILHILSPAASPLAVAVVWARAPDLPPPHRRHRRWGQRAPAPGAPCLPASVARFSVLVFYTSE